MEKGAEDLSKGVNQPMVLTRRLSQAAAGVDGYGVAHQPEKGDVLNAVAVGERAAEIDTFLAQEDSEMNFEDGAHRVLVVDVQDGPGQEV